MIILKHILAIILIFNISMFTTTLSTYSWHPLNLNDEGSLKKLVTFPTPYFHFEGPWFSILQSSIIQNLISFFFDNNEEKSNGWLEVRNIWTFSYCAHYIELYQIPWKWFWSEQEHEFTSLSCTDGSLNQSRDPQHYWYGVCTCL